MSYSQTLFAVSEEGGSIQSWPIVLYYRVGQKGGFIRPPPPPPPPPLGSQVLSDIIEADVLTLVRHSPAIGLMRDESTDISITKELILYARILYIKVHGVKAYYLKLIHISDGKVETIVKAILAYLEKNDISFSTITGFGSDRANVMVRSTSGVA